MVSELEMKVEADWSNPTWKTNSLSRKHGLNYQSENLKKKITIPVRWTSNRLHPN